MKEGDKLVEQLHNASFRRYQARLLWTAFAGRNYEPVWWYWEDYKKTNLN